jgi:hypothetical protein
MRCGLVCLIASVCCSTVGCFLGAIIAEVNLHHQQFAQRASRIERVLSAHPEFRMLRVNEESSGNAYVVGSVPSDAARDKLRRLLADEEAAEWAAKFLAGVNVTAPSAGK